MTSIQSIMDAIAAQADERRGRDQNHAGLRTPELQAQLLRDQLAVYVPIPGLRRGDLVRAKRGLNRWRSLDDGKIVIVTEIIDPPIITPSIGGSGEMSGARDVLDCAVLVWAALQDVYVEHLCDSRCLEMVDVSETGEITVLAGRP